MSRTERNPLTMEHALLGFLRQRPMHGYEIYQHLMDPDGLWLVWRMKQSQLYALLVKLEAEEYITSTLHPQDARPPRKVYKLTRAGRERYLAWVRSAVPHGRELRQDFFGKLYFALREGPDVAAELLARQREACHAWLADMRAAQELSDEDVPGLHLEPSFESFVSHFRIGQIEAMLQWIDSSERKLLVAAH
jgi:PadR family transcriptional regulator, regulatory protein AphA